MTMTRTSQSSVHAGAHDQSENWKGAWRREIIRHVPRCRLRTTKAAFDRPFSCGLTSACDDVLQLSDRNFGPLQASNDIRIDQWVALVGPAPSAAGHLMVVFSH